MPSREEMISFLAGHFRYHTTNPWNKATSYAHNMKIYTFPDKYHDKLYELLNVPEMYDNHINPLVYDFDKKHNYKWQAGFNGRSGGYLVLYEGGVKPETDTQWYRCPKCWSESCYNIPCNKHDEPVSRIEFIKPPDIFAMPGKGIDHRMTDPEDFEEWEDYEVEERYEIVKEFDDLAEEIRDAAIYLCENYNIEDEEYTVRKTRKVLVETPCTTSI